MLYLYVTETLLILLIDGSVRSSKPPGTKWYEFFTLGSLTADGWQKVSYVFFPELEFATVTAKVKVRLKSHSFSVIITSVERLYKTVM